MNGKQKIDDNICEIHNLCISTNTTKIVKNVNIDIKRGKITAIVGQSGSGKSLTAMAITRLLDEGTFTLSGKILIDGINVLSASKKDLRNIRKGKISYIFQNPEEALNPNLTIGFQLKELIDGENKTDKIINSLRAVEINLPEKRLNSYPFELSGGMQQRVCITMALISGAEFIIADEPTTALDVTLQRQILDLLKKLQAERDLSILLITHNFGIVSEYADVTYVMHNGEIIEQGDTREILHTPQQEYTRKLLSTIVSI